MSGTDEQEETVREPDAETVYQALLGHPHLIPGYMTEEGRLVFAAFKRLEARVSDAEKALREILYEVGSKTQMPVDAAVAANRIARAALSLSSGAAAESGEACEHDWRDARNPIIESGEMCAKCGAMQAGNANSAAASGDRQHTPPGDFYPSDWAG